MKITNPKLQKIFNYLSKINKTAYKNEFLITNNVLSKNPFSSSMINNYLLDKQPAKVGTFFKAKKLFLYYKNNFAWLIAYAGKSIIHRMSRQSYQLPTDSHELVIIDTAIYIKRAINGNSFEDLVFPGLLKILKDKRIPFVLTPILYGSGNLAQLFLTLRLIKHKNIPVLTEFQIVRGTDFFKILSFLILYPVSLIRLIKSLGTSCEDQLLTHALWETSDDLVASSYMRLLFGKKLSALPVPKIKCISWYENQTRHKSFYKGLRNTPEKVVIFGAQLLIWPETILNIHPDNDEIAAGTVPDKVIVNGPYYLVHNDQICYQVGPSFRYKKLLHFKVSPKNSKRILAVLSNIEKEIESALYFLVQFPENFEIYLKFHPSTDISRYKHRLPINIKIADDDLYECFKTTKLVIGRSTGALVEAISLGIPTIVLDDNRLSHDFIPPQADGKGLLWEKASNISEALELIKQFDKNLITKSDEIESLTQQYKEMFFCEPSDQKIIETFDLN
jgi:hypothetical protein